MRNLAAIAFLTLSSIAAGAGPGTGIAWANWTNQLFDRAAREHKFVLLSLETQWCEDCHDMDADTFTDAKVQEVIAKQYIAVRVDNSARPDLANRYWDYELPGIVIFNSDGSEIIRQQGYISPQGMASLLQAVIDDPSPGPSIKPEPVIEYSPSPSINPTVLKDVQKSFDSQYDIPAQNWVFEVQYLDNQFVEYGLSKAGGVNDDHLRVAIRRNRQLVDPVWGGVYQSLVVPVFGDDTDHTAQFVRVQISGHLDTTGDTWNTPRFQKTASTQAQAIQIFAAAYERWHERENLTAALNVADYVRDSLQSSVGAFYTGQAGFVDAAPSNRAYFARDDRGRKAIGIPTVDKNIYTRENGELIRAFCKLYLVSNDRRFLDDAERAAQWVVEHRSLPSGGFSHAEHDSGGPYLIDSLEMGRAFLGLYAATHNVRWLTRAGSALGFIEKTFLHAGTAGVLATASATVPRYQPHANREENAALICFVAELTKLSGEHGHRELVTSAMRYLVTKEVATSNFSAPLLLAWDRYTRYINATAPAAR